MCNGCMQTQIDITELIPKQGQLQMCNKCIRYIKISIFLFLLSISFLFKSYLQPPNTWISAQLESRELLTVCLKRIKGLNKEVNQICFYISFELMIYI
jgi:nonsense-mediated mRNA decay protein 3